MKKFLMICLLLMSLIGCDSAAITYEKKFYRIKQLSLTNRQDAYVAFLSGGASEDTAYFEFYIQSPNGAITLKKVKTQFVTIYEKNDTYLAEETIKYYGQCDCYPREWVLYIPENSIVNQIDINIKQ